MKRIELNLYTEFLLLIGLVVAYGLAAHGRNAVWKNELSLWQDVVDKSPLKFRGHNNLGDAYMEMGQYDLAKDQYDITLRINPDADKTHNNLGYMYYKMGLLDIAIREYKTALDFDPHNAQFNYNIAAAYNKKGLSEDAIRHYRKALLLQPDHYKALYNLGTIYAELGLLGKAFVRLKDSLAIKPDQPKALYNLALVCEQLAKRVEDEEKKKLLDQAIKAYEKVLEIDPGYVQAVERIAKIRVKRK